MRIDRRSLLIGTGLAAVGGLGQLRTPKPIADAIGEAEFGASIPGTVAGWTARKSQQLVLPPQDGSDKLYENIETRIFEGEGLPSIMMLLAFSTKQQNDIQVHRPEVCYPAAGFPIVWTRPAKVEFQSISIPARELLAARGEARERIVYWVRVGDTFPTSWSRQRITMALQNLKGRVPDGALFRVSMIEQEKNSNSEAITKFIEAYLEETPSSFRDTVIL